MTWRRSGVANRSGCNAIWNIRLPRPKGAMSGRHVCRVTNIPATRQRIPASSSVMNRRTRMSAAPINEFVVAN